MPKLLLTTIGRSGCGAEWISTYYWALMGLDCQMNLKKKHLEQSKNTVLSNISPAISTWQLNTGT